MFGPFWGRVRPNLGRVRPGVGLYLRPIYAALDRIRAVLGRFWADFGRVRIAFGRFCAWFGGLWAGFGPNSTEFAPTSIEVGHQIWPRVREVQRISCISATRLGRIWLNVSKFEPALARFRPESVELGGACAKPLGAWLRW